MKQTSLNAFIGSQLNYLPHSKFVYATNEQIIFTSKRRLARFAIQSQTFVYSKLNDEKIIHCCCHQPLQLYLILTNQCLIALNGEGEIVKRIYNQVFNSAKSIYIFPMKNKSEDSNQRRDRLVLLQQQHMVDYQVIFHYERSFLKNKSICDVDLRIEEEGKLIDSPDYFQYQKYLSNVNVLICWNIEQTCLYSTPTLLEQKVYKMYEYKRISRRQNRSLDYAICLSLSLMIVAYELGTIKIYQLGMGKKFMAELKGHQCKCLSLYSPVQSPHLLYSAAADNSVRIWNLFYYEQVYFVGLDIIFEEAWFINATMLLVSGQRMALCNLNTNSLIPIINTNRQGHLLKLRCDQQWCASIYSNSHLQFFSIKNQENHLNNQKIQYPLHYGRIRDVFKISPSLYAIAIQHGFSMVSFKSNQIAYDNFQLKKLVYNESILKMSQNQDYIELIHQKLLGTYIFHVISDWKNIPTQIKITAITFCTNLKLPKWDVYNKSKAEQGIKKTFAVIGTEKGPIYFIDIQHREKFYSKVSFHQSQVDFINQLKGKWDKLDSATFISTSKDKSLAIWTISHNCYPSALVTVKFNRIFTYKEVFSDFIVLGESNGELSIIEVLKIEQKCELLKNTGTSGHLAAVTCADYINVKGKHCFITGGEDCMIKIWKGVEKQLIFQLKVFGIISALSFVCQNMDFIVCHNQQISFIKQSNLHQLKEVHNRIHLKSSGLEIEVNYLEVQSFFFKSHIHGHLTKIDSNHKNEQIQIKDHSRIHDQLDINQRQKIGNSLKIGKTDTFEHLAKRFRISNTSMHQLDHYTQGAFLLPAINDKRKRKSSLFDRNIAKGNQLIDILKQNRQKCYSNAGKKRY